MKKISYQIKKGALAFVFAVLCLSALAETSRAQTAEQLFNRAVASLDTGQYDSAIADLNRVVALKPDYADAYLERGRAYGFQNKIALALADSETAFRLCSGCAGAYILRGNIYNSQQKYDEAIKDFTTVIAKKDFNEWTARHVRGSAYIETNKFDLAITDLNRAIELNKESGNIYVDRAKAYNRFTQNYAAAIADATAAFKIDDKDGDALLQRGYAFMKLKNWKAAEYDYTQAFALGSGSANSYVNRGQVYEGLNKPDLAIADYRKALELEPKHELGKKNLAAALARQKKN